MNTLVDFCHAVFIASLIGLCVSLYFPSLAPIALDQDKTDDE